MHDWRVKSMLYLIHKIALCDNKSLKCAERGFIYHKTYERPTWCSRYYQAFKGIIWTCNYTHTNTETMDCSDQHSSLYTLTSNWFSFASLCRDNFFETLTCKRLNVIACTQLWPPIDSVPGLTDSIDYSQPWGDVTCSTEQLSNFYIISLDKSWECKVLLSLDL